MKKFFIGSMVILYFFLACVAEKEAAGNKQEVKTETEIQLFAEDTFINKDVQQAGEGHEHNGTEDVAGAIKQVGEGHEHNETEGVAGITLDDIIGVWNRTRLDIVLEGERDDNEHWIRLTVGGKRYIGYLNSVIIDKRRGDEYYLVCEGEDRIINWHIENSQLILEVESADNRRLELLDERGKVGVNLIVEDIIYFILLEGSTYSFINYGEEFPYIRARLLPE